MKPYMGFIHGLIYVILIIFQEYYLQIIYIYINLSKTT